MSLDGKRLLKVFLCHASGDKPPVRDLYRRLVAEGVDAWLDQEKLLPGQDWRMEIPLAVQESDVVVVCLSNKSITKEGYIQKEIKFALDVAEEKPDGAIFLIPARLEDCPVPERLSRWQWVDLYEENGFIRLLRSLKLRAAAVGAVIEPVAYEDAETEQQHRIDQLYTEGLAAFYTEDWDRACRRFQAILSEQPNHRNAAEKLEEAQCQRDYARLYSRASQAYRSEDWQTALEALGELSQKAPDYKDTAQLFRDVRKREQLTELYAEAKALHAAQKWQAVIKVFEQIAILEPNYPDADGLLATAHKEVVELERLTQLNDQYGRALREMDSGHWHEARGLLETIHKSQIGFLDTERLLRKVETEIQKIEEVNRRTIQVQTLYKQAHEFIRSKNWRKALEKMEEIRKLDVQFADAEGIFDKARVELEREDQEAQRQRKLNGLYAEAVSLLQARKYQEALESWNAIQAIDPSYKDSSRVRKIAKRKLDDLASAETPGKLLTNWRDWIRFDANIPAERKLPTETFLLFAFVSVLVIAVLDIVVLNWMEIGKAGAFVRFFRYSLLGGLYGTVLAFTLSAAVFSWNRKQSLVVIAGWFLSYGFTWLAWEYYYARIETPMVPLINSLAVGAVTFIAIKWARPATTGLGMILIFAGWVLAWNARALLGNHLDILNINYTSAFAQAFVFLLGVLFTVGLQNERLGEVLKTALLGAIGFALGDFIANLLSTLPSFPVELLNAVWGIIGGAIIEVPSRDLRRIVFSAVMCGAGLLVGSYIAFDVLPAMGIEYANSTFSDRNATLHQLIVGLGLGLGFGILILRASAIGILVVLGAGINLIARALTEELFHDPLIWESVVRGALVGLVFGFGYAYLGKAKLPNGQLQAAKTKWAWMAIVGLLVVTISIVIWRVSSLQIVSNRWDFDHSTEGWRNYNDLGYIQIKNGALTLRSTGLDPSFEFPDSLNIPASKTPVITVRMRITQEQGTIGEIFFLTDQNRNWSGTRSVAFTLNQDGTYQTYNIFMAEHPSWRGTVTGIRLDPVGDPTMENVQIAIDYISVHAP